MKKLFSQKTFLSLFLIGAVHIQSTAKENVTSNGSNGNNPKPGAPVTLVAACARTTAQTNLDINNVRATILVGGDMWWDLENAKYEIPKNSGKTSIFAGALWIGGLDAASQQIRTAAQTYRQTGIDFWGGPLDTANATITDAVCIPFDKHFKITKEEVQNFIDNPSDVTDVIKNWPGNGTKYSPGAAKYLAPFYDRAGDGIYDYTDGDFPGYALKDNTYPNITIPNTSFEKVVCNDFLFGSQTLWWVFNDAGNAHTETGSNKIGLEIRAQAFAFKSNSQINDMTFYKYQIINRSSSAFTKTYFGQWVDPDLGDYLDDFVGCDVRRGLGYCYNGDNDDGGASGYGTNPPCLGVDFFQGPLADVGDGIDNDRDGCLDCTYIKDDDGNIIATVPDADLPEQIIMAKFVYYNNDASPQGNPNGFTDFYNYLQGIWRDGQGITYGGNGKGTGGGATNTPCSFMFPDTTDAVLYPIHGAWTEVTAGNTPADRRFLQSAGPFTLQPGAVNYITTGVVWAQTKNGDRLESIKLVQQADDKAQALFDACFDLIDGPSSPDLTIRELNNSFIFSMDKYMEKSETFEKIDPTITGFPDSLRYYRFQGYQVYQLRQPQELTVNDLRDVNKARLVFQCDRKDGIGKIVNYIFDESLNAVTPTIMVEGTDAGISHTFKVDRDLFSNISGGKLVNHKVYYYTVVAYAYNNYKTYNPNDPTALDGQKLSYLAGSTNRKIYSAIPHASEVESGGQILNSAYGDAPSITRIEGQGNGGYLLNLADGMHDQIFSNGRIGNAVYIAGNGPMNVKVVDPTTVKNGNFEVRFDGITDNNFWNLSDGSNTYRSDSTLGYQSERVVPQYGISISANNIIEAGKAGAINNAFLGASISYKDNSKRWLNFLKDADGDTPDNWIRSGTTLDPADYVGVDDDQIYEGVLDGTWAPYKLAAKDAYYSPKYPYTATEDVNTMALSPTGTIKTSIASVDLVMTSDRSKWSRAAVIEMAPVGYSYAAAKKFDLRKDRSIDFDGNPGGDVSVRDSFMGWFPGYAVNLETGERLNIAYGENSFYTAENGRDMRWNPSSNKYAGDSLVYGGMHYIFIFGHNSDNPIADVPAYDSCRYIVTQLDSANRISPLQGAIKRRNVWKDCMWTAIPMLASNQSVLATDVTIKLRIARSYRTFAPVTQIRNNVPLTDGVTYYVASEPVAYNAVSYTVGQSFTAIASVPKFIGNGTVTTSSPQNGFNPYYKFSITNFQAVKNDNATAQDALNLINVVPNPYYAYSAYEGTVSNSNVGQLDNRIRIVNIPSKCTIKIFNLNGTLVRTINRDLASDLSSGGIYSDLKNPNFETSTDWDLKNDKGVPIASGVYIINVNAPGIGERNIKWFGILRPIDLNTF